jgi:hypothetical protein
MFEASIPEDGDKSFLRSFLNVLPKYMGIFQTTKTFITFTDAVTEKHKAEICDLVRLVE